MNKGLLRVDEFMMEGKVFVFGERAIDVCLIPLVET